MAMHFYSHWPDSQWPNSQLPDSQLPDTLHLLQRHIQGATGAMAPKLLTDVFYTLSIPIIDQGRIQEFILGSQTKFSNRKLRAKRLRIEGKARTEGKARETTRGGVWGGGSVSPSPEIFWKIELQTIHFGAYLRQTFEINNNMHGSRTCSIATFMNKSILIYLISGNCLILLKHKKVEDLGDKVPQKLKPFSR
jgi:hypothetical protein